MQSLPSIRLVQENDKALVAKIGSTMANTVPLWRQQLAMAVTIARSAEAGDTLKQATDLTNELLTANADTLRTSTRAIRTQIDVASSHRGGEAGQRCVDRNDRRRAAHRRRRQAPAHRSGKNPDRVRSGAEAGADRCESASGSVGNHADALKVTGRGRQRTAACRAVSRPSAEFRRQRIGKICRHRPPRSSSSRARSFAIGRSRAVPG